MNDSGKTGELSLRSAALIAGFGLLVMAVCAPLAHFLFMPQSVVPGDGAATLEGLRTNGTPFLVGAMFLFVTYLMDILVAWALYWYLRPGQAALSQLVAWMRLVCTAIAFTGLLASLKAYDLANASNAFDALDTVGLQSEILFQLSAAGTIEGAALLLFGLHLWVMSVLVWRSSHVPKWITLMLGLAGVAYVVPYLLDYFAPGIDLGWLLILGLGELVFMAWLLAVGWRRTVES